eukprot:979032-Pyramimonas_sp.AAC.1
MSQLTGPPYRMRTLPMCHTPSLLTTVRCYRYVTHQEGRYCALMPVKYSMYLTSYMLLAATTFPGTAAIFFRFSSHLENLRGARGCKNGEFRFSGHLSSMRGARECVS